jgi:hypothetical protein
MDGFIKRTMSLLCAGGLAAAAAGCSLADYGGGSGCNGGGCNGGGNGGHGGILCCLYDNCWPERYNYQAAQSVMHTFGAQVENGHVLDQTIWTYHFETGTALLTRGGQDWLVYLARRRPAPDCHIFLQTAQDVVYDPNAPEKYVEERAKLNEERRASILRFLNAETAGRGLSFEVTIHDPPPVGLPAPAMAQSIRLNYGSFRGSLYGGLGGGAAVPAPVPSGGVSP